MQRNDPPKQFVAELRRRFPDFVDLRMNNLVNRWEFIFKSQANIPVSQFWGWTRNPVTGERIEPDPVTGLTPFRDLDVDAQKEILVSLEKTFIGNVGGWKTHAKETMRFNKELHKKKIKDKADDYAYALQQVDLRRPWVKEHTRNAKPIITYAR